METRLPTPTRYRGSKPARKSGCFVLGALVRLYRLQPEHEPERAGLPVFGCPYQARHRRQRPHLIHPLRSRPKPIGIGSCCLSAMCADNVTERSRRPRHRLFAGPAGGWKQGQNRYDFYHGTLAAADLRERLFATIEQGHTARDRFQSARYRAKPCLSAIFRRQ